MKRKELKFEENSKTCLMKGKQANVQIFYRLKTWKDKEDSYLNKIRQYENIINDING